MRFAWDHRKNDELERRGRPIFEDVLEALSIGGLLLEGENPTHPGQRLMIVRINDCPHVVPYEIRMGVFWLITVFPARKYKTTK